jgi:N-methylhydantoinase A
MGGTTAKASLIENGAVSRGREYEVGGSLSAGSRLMRGSGELLRIPTIDIAEVGAGGGSLAWLDPAGGMQVGPRSAGAAPGPACYGRGGVEPTVTDANVFLGYIPEGPLADGQIAVSRRRAEQALERVAEPLGLSTAEVAAGIHAIANARMTRALRSVSSEKGRDPREFALIAYGGAGPVHAVGLAEDLGCRTVLVPALAGLFSSLGLLYARPEFHEVRTCHIDARSVRPTEIDAVYAELKQRLDGVEFIRSAELRYGGQTWEIEIEVGDPADMDAVMAAFEDEHERLYGIRGEAGSPIEIRALRLAALGRSAAVDRLSLVDGFAARSATRETVLGELPVRTRASVGETAERGPMLIDEYDTTVVVRPGWTVRRDPATATLLLEKE